MNAALIERDLFAPQQPSGMRSGLGLAILAHVLLVLAIAWSVHWRASEPEGVVAELWSSVPQVAAPRTTPPPEAKPTPPAAKPTPPVPKPAPPVEAKPAPSPPVRVDAQIAIERERAAREKARQDELERERVEAAKKAEQKKRDDAKRLEAERERLATEQAEKKRLAEQAEKKRLAEQAKKDEVRQATIRDANLKRMMKEAGGSDDPAATGTAARTAGPSSGYAGRIKARVKPNIVLTTALDGNPAATVEVRVAPDGTIVGKKLVTSSGSSIWDETVLRAIDKTEVLPKDVDGRVPSPITITFRPRD